MQREQRIANLFVCDSEDADVARVGGAAEKPEESSFALEAGEEERVTRKRLGLEQRGVEHTDQSTDHALDHL